MRIGNVAQLGVVLVEKGIENQVSN